MKERTNYSAADEAQISRGNTVMEILHGEEEDAVDAVRPEAVQRKNWNGPREFNRVSCSFACEFWNGVFGITNILFDLTC